MKKGIIILVIGILIFSLFPILILKAQKEVLVDELCVDGLNGINLNGIMCKHEYITYFNLEYNNILNEFLSLLPIMFFIFGFATILIGLGIMLNKEDNKKEFNY